MATCDDLESLLKNLTNEVTKLKKAQGGTSKAPSNASLVTQVKQAQADIRKLAGLLRALQSDVNRLLYGTKGGAGIDGLIAAAINKLFGGLGRQLGIDTLLNRVFNLEATTKNLRSGVVRLEQEQKNDDQEFARIAAAALATAAVIKTLNTRTETVSNKVQQLEPQVGDLVLGDRQQKAQIGDLVLGNQRQDAEIKQTQLAIATAASAATAAAVATSTALIAAAASTAAAALAFAYQQLDAAIIRAEREAQRSANLAEQSLNNDQNLQQQINNLGNNQVQIIDRPVIVQTPVFIDRVQIVEKLQTVTVSVISERVITVDKPIVTEKIVQVDKPIVTQKIVQVDKPIVTEKIVQVDKPIVTEKIVQVDRLLVREKLQIVDRPVVTEKLQIVDRPVVTEKLQIVDRPVVTEKLQIVDRPIVTEKLQIVDRPVVTEKLQIVDRPVVTEKLQIVDRPVVTEKLITVPVTAITERVVTVPVTVVTEKVVPVNIPVVTEKIVTITVPAITEKIVPVPTPIVTEKIFTVNVPLVTKEIVQVEKTVLVPQVVTTERTIVNTRLERVEVPLIMLEPVTCDLITSLFDCFPPPPTETKTITYIECADECTDAQVLTFDLEVPVGGLTAFMQEKLLQNTSLAYQGCGYEPTVAVPEWWQERIEYGRPQLVISFAEYDPIKRRLISGAKYTLTIPHYDGGKPVRSPISSYSSGRHQRILRLKDNSKVIVYAKDEATAVSVLAEARRVINPSQLQGALELPGGNLEGSRRLGTSKIYYPKVLTYYPEGLRAGVKPEYIINLPKPS